MNYKMNTQIHMRSLAEIKEGSGDGYYNTFMIVLQNKLNNNIGVFLSIHLCLCFIFHI